MYLLQWTSTKSARILICPVHNTDTETMKQSALEIINDRDKNHLTEYYNARESKYSNNKYKVKDTLEGLKFRTQNVWILLKLSVI